ncbi:MAG: hypothetical protein ACRCS9_09190 [Hyphomicrobium sp.]
MVQDVKIMERPAVSRRKRTAVSLPEETEFSITRFAPHIRRELRRMVRQSSRIGELLAVFPGAAFALAIRRGSAAQRLEAVSLIEKGAPLKSVARVLDVPMWLRRLPPEAFDSLPHGLPGGDAFTRHIANRLPAPNTDSAQWLSTLIFAHHACHEAFALWIASQHIYRDDGDPRGSIAVLAAYAWYSGQPQTAAHKLIVVPWRPEIAFDTALCAAKSWFNRVRLVLQLPSGIITDPWLKPGTVHGHSFEPLLDCRALLDEAHAMHNCADQYAERIVREKCRLFSVRRNGQRAATLEIGPHPREVGVLAVNQLKTRHNMAAGTDVWQAVYAWMASQGALKRVPPLSLGERLWDQAAWGDLMAPYRAATGGADWIDTHASQFVFSALDADLSELARRGGVSSWLFT